MKICLIVFQYPPMINGGVGSSCYRIATNLANSGVEIHVIAPGNNRIGESIVPVQEKGVIVHRTFPSLGNAYGAREELREAGNYAIELHGSVDFDLIHSMFLIPTGLMGAIVAKEISRPFISSIHGSDVETMRYCPVFLGTIRWILEQASFVTSVSTQLLWRAQRIVQIGKCSVIPNAFDSSIFNMDPLQEILNSNNGRLRVVARKLLRIKKKGKLVIGTSSLIREVKGFPVIMAAFKKLTEIYPNVCFVLIGDFFDSQEKKIWTRWIQKNGLKHRIIFTGRVAHNDVLAWMKELDIFVLPSLHEGYPNALIEAMACGLPSVASNVGGILDIVTDKINGLLVPPGSVEDLSKKLDLLLRNDELRKTLGRSAIETVKQKLSFQQETEAWLAVYKDVIRNGQTVKI